MEKGLNKEEKARGKTLIDAHVHLRSGFDVKEFFLASRKNFGLHRGEVEKVTGVLCIADARGERGYDRIQRFIEDGGLEGSIGPGNWEVVPTAENITLSVAPTPAERLVFIAGRQLISNEGLEVLAVGTRSQFGIEKSAEALIREIAEEGALPILPWGFGKWMGARGRLVKRLLRNPKSPLFSLGDSANRPALWPRPDHFRHAKRQGVSNIPGSDPLPISGEVKQVGNFGAWIPGCLDPENPAGDLKRRLMDPSTAIQYFGNRKPLFHCVWNQVLMQYRKLIR